MAYNVSNNYKNIIYSGDSRHKIKILFNNVELQEADRYCERATIKSRIIPNGAKRFSLNNFISKEVEVILHDIDTSIIQDQISISIGTLVGSSYEYVPIGIFNIQGTPTTDKNKITIKLRDNSVKFDFNYNAKPLIEEEGGSATKLQILQDICTKANVTCNISSFIGSTDSIGIYDNTITARQYIADIAEQAGRIATINRSGELIFVNINSLTTWDIPLSVVEKYEIGKAYRIGKVVYEDAIRKYETASTNYDTLYLDSSNPYISSQEQVNSILQQVNSFEIDSVKTGKILGNPAIDSYDLINVYDDKTQGNPSIFKTLATSDLVYNGVLINTFDTQIGEEERKENVSIVGEATFKKWATTNINNINGEITIQSGEIDNIQKEINPTNTASGSSIYLEDSTDAELVNFEMEGKTTQETSESPLMPSPDYPSNIVSVGTYNNETGKYELKVKTTGKNIFNPSDFVSKSSSSLNTSLIENGINVKRESTTSYTYPIKCKPNTQYTIKFNFTNPTSDYYISFKYSDNTTTTIVGSTTYSSSTLITKTSTANKTITAIKFETYGWANNMNLTYIQLEQGTQGTEYEQYKENVYIYTLNEPIRAIGNIKDRLYIENGYLYVERKIGKTIFNGSENWQTWWNITGYCRPYLQNFNQMKSQSGNVKTTYYSNMDWHTRSSTNNGSTNFEFINTNSNTFYVGISKSRIGGDDSTSASNLLTLFKTWLSTHNTEVNYELATPVIEELGEVDIPSTYKGITYIDTTDELEPNMNITYVRDTQITNYVEEHISQIVVNEEGITQRVQTIEDSDYDSRINAVEQKQTATDLTIDVISTNIDKTTGQIREVTTTTGFTFNAEGLTISDSSSKFSALHRNDGTFYKDGDTTVGQYTKDGSKQKDLYLFGVYYYGMEDINSTPRFIAQLYNDGNEDGVGHFWNEE